MGSKRACAFSFMFFHICISLEGFGEGWDISWCGFRDDTPCFFWFHCRQEGKELPVLVEGGQQNQQSYYFAD